MISETAQEGPALNGVSTTDNSRTQSAEPSATSNHGPQPSQELVKNAEKDAAKSRQRMADIVSYLQNGNTHTPKAQRTAGPTLTVCTPPSNVSKPSLPAQNRDNSLSQDDGGEDKPQGIGRKNVQFASDGAGSENADQRPQLSTNSESISFYGKLKAFAASPSNFSHSRSPSGATLISASPRGDELDHPHAAISERNEPYFPMTLEEDSAEDGDADAEESAHDHGTEDTTSRKRRKKSRRVDMGGIETAPASPQTTRPQVQTTHSVVTSENIRPGPVRRATDTDMSPEDRRGASDDEAHRRSGHKRRGAWRGLSYTAGQRKNSESTPDGRSPETRRPISFRNLTHTASPAAEGSQARPSRRRMISERGTTLSAQKWRQIKQKLQLLGQSKKKERTVDHEKSAELLAELLAGSPAALIAASMFQRDEHGNRRVPVLLEQLKLRVTDSELDKYRENDNPTPGDRHIIFRIELEYGNGVNRMKWVIRRSLRDFANLHIKYKLHFSKQKYVKLKSPDKEGMPRFPKGAFPYLRAYRGLEDEGDDDDDDPGEESGGAGNESGERPSNKTRRTTSYGFHRRKPSTPGTHGITGAIASIGGMASATIPGGKRETYPERQRRKLEVYLQQMIKFMLFRPDNNRLCKFLEVSALGMRLAAEGSYHGKEGFLVLQSGKGVDFRKALTPTNIRNRHTPKWFLVRHSYVVCVDSPEEMHIYDVFLFDPDFKLAFSKLRAKDPSAKELAQIAKENTKHPQHHRLKLQNSERKLKLLARNERQLQQFEESIKAMIDISPWVKQNRYDSFAPVRPNCFAQWLVDGRDHMWVVSRAIDQARDVIYIHDWWLSPEIYMRRPAAISQKWRLDRLLKRKAEQGVKIFVIVYRNIESAIPIDSQYTKFSLLELHPNVFVQRSPNQFRQNTFFWAHHEKLCIIDHTMAFVGGVDLCFGRWDTPQHGLTDDKATGFEPNDLPKDADHCQLWPGKDYSNPRVQDFYALNKPYEEMYDRMQVARMPWHDISMQVVGQPARDLTRHFVQRWNYILRQRKPTRPTPFLLPPPDFKAADLEALGLTGTCEVQMLRSAGPWSLGTPNKTEHSIMNAYADMIKQSEHFIYIENQFFISSCETEATNIMNCIGEALVERAVRAAENMEAWRACIVVPLIPGFQNTVEEEGGTSVRLIMQYQYRSICRGESSLFGRLRAKGIEPEDYIQFYALRQWGKIGPTKMLVTEQLYIHAKCMVVDDRIAIIGSANINERSMLGNRDSECAAIVRDTDMIWSRMNGEPYRVGRFSHTLRMRLMREHLGVDVDKIMEETQAMAAEHEKSRNQAAAKASEEEEEEEEEDYFRDATPAAIEGDSETVGLGGEQFADELFHQEHLHSFNHDVDWEQANNPNLLVNKKMTEDPRVTNNPQHHADVDEGILTDNFTAIQQQGLGEGRDTAYFERSKEVLVSDIDPRGKATVRHPVKRGEVPRLPTFVMESEAPNPPLPPKPQPIRMTTSELGLTMLSQLPSLPDTDDTDIGGPAANRAFSNASADPGHPLMDELKRPYVDRDCMQDPLHDTFFDDTWHAIADNNTKIYRAVFRCMPDNEVKNWAQYKEYVAYEERFKHMQGHDAVNADKALNQSRPDTATSGSGPPGAGVKSAVGSTAAGIKAATQVRTVGQLPLEAEKKLAEFSEKLTGLVGSENSQEKANEEKDKLRHWAADANKAQMERQGRTLARSNTLPYVLDEKSGLETVPEARTPTPPQTGDGATTDSATEVAVSSPSTAVAEKLSSHQIGYSETLNMNAQAPATRRRRGTTRSSRRAFMASDDILSQATAEELLNMVQGHLVMWPYEW